MNLQKCENGHFYDADKYPTCPHCQMMGDDPKTIGMAGAPEPDRFAAAGAAGGATAPPKMPSFVPSDDAPTVGIFHDPSGVQPVVGWLVCIRGGEFGKSFTLKEGKNFIGRGPDMDVVITKDRAISRNRHACLIYEPHERVFFVQPGESHELFYLNESVVLNNEMLQAGDVLLLGETELLFVPLCGPNFSWTVD